MTKKISGTKEWSVESVNCLTGCSHDCRYCYGRASALRFGRIRSAAEWGRPKVQTAAVAKRRRRVEGTVMFPSTHDILPEFLDPCLTVLLNVLEAGNRVLIVSKPHCDCIRAIVEEFGDYRDRILFRFTIGALDEELLAYWEPGAPTFAERYAALSLARAAGFRTSVSCEPLLDADWVLHLVAAIEDQVTDTIWIGKMNQPRARAAPGTSAEALARIEAGQTDERIRAIYRGLKDHPKIRWKESYKRILGLEEATVAGQDV